MAISPAAETIFKIGNINITNSIFTAFVVVVLLSFFAIIIGSKLTVEKPTKTQLFLEIVFEGFLDIVKGVLGKATDIAFPILFTFLIFILFSNWFGLLPITGTIGFIHNEENTYEVAENNETHITIFSCLKNRNCIITNRLRVEESKEFVPIFRAPTSDVSITAALSLTSVITSNVLGLMFQGIGFVKKYFNFNSITDFFVGILELISEIGKIISFTFRLFGNIFAGEVLLLVITTISYGLATLPFMALEVFVGFIQALVFFMLSAVFMSLSVLKHE